MNKFVLINTRAGTPGLSDGSVEVQAPTPVQAVADLLGCNMLSLDCHEFGPAPGVWSVGALPTTALGEVLTIIVVLRD